MVPSSRATTSAGAVPAATALLICAFASSRPLPVPSSTIVTFGWVCLYLSYRPAVLYPKSPKTSTCRVMFCGVPDPLLVLLFLEHPAAAAKATAATRATAANPRRRGIPPILKTPLRSRSLSRRGHGRPPLSTSPPCDPERLVWGCGAHTGDQGMWRATHLRERSHEIAARLHVCQESLGSVPISLPASMRMYRR